MLKMPIFRLALSNEVTFESFCRIRCEWQLGARWRRRQAHGISKRERELTDHSSVDISIPMQRTKKKKEKKLKQEETKRKKIKIKIKYLVVFSSVVFVPFAFHSGVYLFKRCWCSLPCDFASFLCKAFGRRRRRATQTPNMYREMWERFTEYIRIYWVSLFI